MRRFGLSVCSPRVAAVALPLLLTCSALALASAGVLAQRTQFQIDPAQSTVHFALGDSLHHFAGTFQIASADIAFDPTLHQIHGRIAIDSATGNSGSKARDKRMANEELRAGDFPTVTFEPQSYTGDLSLSGPSQIQVSGIFTLLGQPHPITVPMSIQMNGSHCTASGQFDVPYIAWGLKDPSMLFVKMQKQVRIDLTLNGQILQQ